MPYGDALRGRTVLIVHEDPFRRDYLAAVLRAAGAEVAGPVPGVAEALDLVGTTCADAMVLSASLDDAASSGLLIEARRRGIVTLVVQAQPASPAGDEGDAMLTAPYAGFQVAEALVGLLAAAGEPTPPREPALQAR